MMEISMIGGLAGAVGSLAGSTATMDHCVRTFKESTGCTVVEAVEAASLHPAQVLGIDSHKGTLNIGADADFVFLDSELRVKATFVGGQLAWKSDDAFPDEFPRF